MPAVEGLRSPYDKTAGGLHHLGRMLDKMRLKPAGKLPSDFVRNYGLTFGLDGILCGFLNVKFEEIEVRVARTPSQGRTQRRPPQKSAVAPPTARARGAPPTSSGAKIKLKSPSTAIIAPMDTFWARENGDASAAVFPGLPPSPAGWA